MEIKFKGVILSELNQYPDSKEKEDALLKIKEIHKPSHKYKKNGFKFSDKWLKEARGHIILLPIELIADYVHLDQKIKIDNNNDAIDGLKSVLKNIDLFYYFQQMKTNILGVLAYGALNAKDDEAIYCVTKALNMYYDWYCYAISENRDGIEKMADEHKAWLKTLN